MKPVHAFRLAVWAASLGALSSAYLLYHHLMLHMGLQDGPSLCAINERFNCDSVAMSEYSELAGVPVAGLGLFFFLFALRAMWVFRGEFENPRTWSVLRVLSVLGLLPIIALFTISFAILKIWCIVCLFSYGMTLLFAVAAFRVSLPKVRGGLVDLFKLATIGLGKSVELSSLVATLFLALGAVLAPTISLANHRAHLPPPTADEVAQQEYSRWARGISDDLHVVLEGEGRDFSFGSPTPKAEVVVFSDFGCPACRRMASSLHRLAKEFPIRVVFKNFPLDQACNRLITRPFHPVSCRAAALARCAGRENVKRFWELHDAFFANENLDEAFVEKFEDEALRACLPEEKKRIQRDIELGISLGLQGTPTVFVNSKRVPNVSESALRAIFSRIP